MSQNEKVALELTAQGLKNRKIANIMTYKKVFKLSEKTESTYVRKAKEKLDVPYDMNIYFLVAKAIEL